MVLSYLIATAGFVKGVGIGAVLAVSAKKCCDRRRGRP